MNIGMLWFDNDPKTQLTQKIDTAAEYYQNKYGEKPTHCYVNPKMLLDKKKKEGNIQIKTNPTVLHHHLWIGIERKTEIK